MDMGLVTTEESQESGNQGIVAVVLLVAVAAGGIFALQFFWRQILRPGDLSAFSLPVVALVAGVAATFNPCGLPTLPGFLAAMGGGAADTSRVRRRASMSLAAAFGAMTIVLLVGILVAVVGEGTKGIVGPNFRWIQLSVGLFLVAIAVLHLLDKTHSLPLVGPIMGAGGQVWDVAMREQSTRNNYLFGAGFVLVGVG